MISVDPQNSAMSQVDRWFHHSLDEDIEPDWLHDLPRNVGLQAGLSDPDCRAVLNRSSSSHKHKETQEQL